MSTRSLPPRDDPRWRALVTGTERYRLKGLATQMVLTRVRLMCFRKEPAAIEDAIATAHDFFSRNLEVAAEDLETLFGPRCPPPESPRRERPVSLEEAALDAEQEALGASRGPGERSRSPADGPAVYAELTAR